MRLLLRLLFYYGRKLIALHWIKRDPLTLIAWKSLVNANIKMYKMTYDSRGCSKKCNRVWGRWINFRDNERGNCQVLRKGIVGGEQHTSQEFMREFTLDVCWTI